MAEDGYDASAIEVLKSLPPPRKRPKGFVTSDRFSDHAVVMLCFWDGRPDARLNAVADIAIPFMKTCNANPLTVLNELIGAGIVTTNLGMELTAAGKALLGVNGADPGDGPPSPRS